VPLVLIALAGAAPTALGHPRHAIVLALAFVVTAVCRRRNPEVVSTLPLARIALPIAQVAAATSVSLVVGLLVLGSAPDAAPLLAGTVIVLLLTGLLEALARRRRFVRVLVLGSTTESHELQATVRDVGADHYRVVATTDDLDRLDETLAASRSDLVVFTDHVDRDAVLRHVARIMRTRRVHAVPLATFCETALGVVPLASVDAAWLAALASPDAACRESPSARAFDVVVSLTLSVPTLIVIALLAPLIRADGGPVFFRQWRVGRDGRPFEILKLRTMSGVGSDWSSADDPRVTRLGSLLRRTHIDELPQVLNVLKGDMSIVGPRPEQVAISFELEEEIPLFPYRHMVRPGITGWARVRCGYASTTEQSKLKLGNDLFYIKHRSLVLDVAIVLETLRLTLFERQHEVRPPAAAYVLGPSRTAFGGSVPPGLTKGSA
jgi:lipopolysaccharide/colanic/teichoic acid biosynthesis glycosyltransferase